MKNILIISGHPRVSHSTANRLIIEKLIQLPGVDVSDIKSNYPDDNINVDLEQEQLKKADLLIFQFPFIWYGMPSHMRAWLEKVFAYGFAFGEGGSHLKGKPLLLSITLGGSREAYSENGQHLFPVETFLLPLQLFSKYCGMEYLPPVYSYAMSGYTEQEKASVRERASLHAERVADVISNLHSLALLEKNLL
jgi:putative NADPH-quinone reductase